MSILSHEFIIEAPGQAKLISRLAREFASRQFGKQASTWSIRAKGDEVIAAFACTGHQGIFGTWWRLQQVAFRLAGRP
jgi:hypothetical protein